MAKKKKKSDRTLNRILAFMAAFFLVFVAAVFYVFLKTGGSEPAVLVAGVVGVVIAEIISCLRIKLGKQRQEYIDKSDE